VFRNVCNADYEVVTGVLLKIHMPKSSVIAGEIGLAEDVHLWGDIGNTYILNCTKTFAIQLRKVTDSLSKGS